MNKVYLGLGSNIEPREQYLQKAIIKLEEHEQIELLQQSAIYETAPVGYKDQGKFLNMVIEIRTELRPAELLDYCKEIEQELDRKETVRNGPRTVDLDILLYNNDNRDLGTLRIPHPRMHERAFVLIPLYELNPNLVLPTTGKHIDDMLERLAQKDIKNCVKWGLCEINDQLV